MNSFMPQFIKSWLKATKYSQHKQHRQYPQQPDEIERKKRCYFFIRNNPHRAFRFRRYNNILIPPIRYPTSSYILYKFIYILLWPGFLNEYAHTDGGCS